MKKTLLLFILVLLPSLARASADPLVDLQASILQEDYKAANSLAHHLLSQHLPRAQAQEVEYYSGLSFLRLGDYPRALDAFHQLIGERPVQALYEKAFIGLLDVLSLQGLYDAVLKEAAVFMTRHPDSDVMGLVYLKTARANLRLARWKKARELLDKVRTEYPDTFEADLARQLLEEKQYFTVQIGSFLDRTRADRLMRDMLARKEYSYVVETKSGEGKLYYRVRVGQLSSLKDAQDLERRLSGLGYPTLIYP